MVLLLNRPPSSKDLLTASVDAGRLLVSAVAAAPVVTNYFAQVAAHILEADRELFDSRYASAIPFRCASRSRSRLTG